jgi:hypothetical protein
MKNFISLVVVVMATLMFVGCNYASHLGTQVIGSGTKKTEQRNVAAFNAINVSGAYDIDIVSQKSQSLEIEADDNILPLIETDVRDGVLYVHSKKGFSTRNDPHVKITVPDIARIAISGAGTVNVLDLKNEKFGVETHGAADIRVGGETNALAIEMNGAGTVDAKNLRAAKASVATNGAARADVYVTEVLSANVSGAGSINYYGDPKTINKSVSGVGSIAKMP